MYKKYYKTNYRKNIDILISTKEMTDFIKNKYPDLEDACNQRTMYAYLSVLTQLAKNKKQTNKTANIEIY